MGITSGPGIRAARAAIFSALCVALASAAHVLLSGAPLPLPTVTAVTAAVFVLAYVLAGSGERGYWRIAGLLLPLQLAADTIFTAGQAACYGTGDEPFPRQLRFLGLDLICAGGDFGTPLARLAAGDQAPLATPCTRRCPGCCSAPTSASASPPPAGCAAARRRWPGCCTPPWPPPSGRCCSPPPSTGPPPRRAERRYTPASTATGRWAPVRCSPTP